MDSTNSTQFLAVSQVSLDKMVANISEASTNYTTQVTAAATEILNTFNNNWVSPAAQALYTEIVEKLNTLADDVVSVMNTKNDNIATAVSDFNNSESGTISYSGFIFGRPTFTNTLNSTLPGDGDKIGVAEGADLTTISTAMSTLVSKVEAALSAVETAASSSTAFNTIAQGDLASSFTGIKSTFSEAMQGLITSLSDRMSGEMLSRTATAGKVSSELSAGATPSQ